MKMTISQQELKRAVGLVKGVALANSAPSLAVVSIEADVDGTVVSATDLDQHVCVRVEALVEEPGRAFLPARRIADVAPALPDAAVTVEADGSTARIRAKRAKFAMPESRGEDFPPFPDGEAQADATAQAAALSAALSAVAPCAASRSDARDALKGVHMEVAEGGVTVTASDAVVLFQRRVPCDASGAASATVPAAFASAVASAMQAGQAHVSILPRRVIVACGGVLMSARTVAASYPNADAFFRQPPAFEASVETSAMRAAMRRAQSATRAGRTALLTFGPAEIVVEASGEDGGMADAVDAECGGEGRIAVNPIYAATALKAVGADEASLGWRGEMQPLVVSGPDARGIVMPVRM